nr:hypothetical protein [Armatimonas sp.]
MIDWHTSLLIVAVLLGIALLWAFWDALTSAFFAGVVLILARLITWIWTTFRRVPPPPPE